MPLGCFASLCILPVELALPNSGGMGAAVEDAEHMTFETELDGACGSAGSSCGAESSSLSLLQRSARVLRKHRGATAAAAATGVSDPSRTSHIPDRVVINSDPVFSKPGTWSDYATCPPGFAVGGLASLYLLAKGWESNGRANSFECSNLGCRALCTEATCMLSARCVKYYTLEVVFAPAVVSVPDTWGSHSTCPDGFQVLGLAEMTFLDKAPVFQLQNVIDFECSQGACHAYCSGSSCRFRAVCGNLNDRSILLDVVSGMSTRSPKDGWGPSARCPPGYDAMGLAKVELLAQVNPVVQHLQYQECDSRGCRVWCTGLECRAVARCARILPGPQSPAAFSTALLQTTTLMPTASSSLPLPNSSATPSQPSAASTTDTSPAMFSTTSLQSTTLMSTASSPLPLPRSSASSTQPAAGATKSTSPATFSTTSLQSTTLMPTASSHLPLPSSSASSTQPSAAPTTSTSPEKQLKNIAAIQISVSPGTLAPAPYGSPPPGPTFSPLIKVDHGQEVRRSELALDCLVTDWSQWSDCYFKANDVFKASIQERVRKVVHPPMPGGAQCPERYESRACMSVLQNALIMLANSFM